MYRLDGAAVRSASGWRDSGEDAAPGAVVIPFRRPFSSAFPELDPVRDRFPVALLAQAERRASALAVSADRVLIAGGFIAEEEYLHAYARSTGIAFEPLHDIPRPACPLDDDRMLDAVAAGVLPLRVRGETIYVVTPRGDAARRMLQLTGGNPNFRRRFRLTSAERLHRFVIRHCGAALGSPRR